MSNFDIRKKVANSEQRGVTQSVEKPLTSKGVPFGDRPYAEVTPDN
jgi:hypothetical protein